MFHTKKQEQLMALSELALAGVKVTVLKSRAAPRQMMRCKGSKGFVSGGYKPTNVVAQTIGV